MPDKGIFGPTTGMDTRLFEGTGLRPGVRAAIMEKLDQALRTDGGLTGSEWESWTRVYLAGGSASEWAGERPNETAQDLDILLGVDYPKARTETFPYYDDDQITTALNVCLRAHFNEPGWEAPFGGYWDVTAYCNPRAWDITNLKPYAAYDLTDGKWAVKPPHLPEHSAADFHPALLAEARAVASQARAILKLPEPMRTREARSLWEKLHADRSRAFSAEGEGWQDAGNVIEKYLAYARGGLLDKIKDLVYAEPVQKTAARQGWWHGTPDERSWHKGDNGIHVGTYDAAKQALEARIGRPAEGEWDGTREYGKTPLVSTGTGVGCGIPEGHPLRPEHFHHQPSYSGGRPIPADARPSIFPVRIKGPMSNSPDRPHEDFKANGYMKAQLGRGRAKNGYYYSNVGEDSGSISAVVPSAEHLERVEHRPHTAAAQPQLEATDYEGAVGNRTHITRNEHGLIPTSAVAHLHGAEGEKPGEHRNRQGKDWEDFKADIARNGITDPVFITVDHGQDPVISEGSHRRDAAVELGHTHVPVEIRYYGHAEQQGTVHDRAMHRTAAARQIEHSGLEDLESEDYPGEHVSDVVRRIQSGPRAPYYHQLREHIREHGVSVPALLEGSTIKDGTHRWAAAWETGHHLPTGDYDNQADYDRSADHPEAKRWYKIHDQMLGPRSWLTEPFEHEAALDDEEHTPWHQARPGEDDSQRALRHQGYVAQIVKAHGVDPGTAHKALGKVHHDLQRGQDVRAARYGFPAEDALEARDPFYTDSVIGHLSRPETWSGKKAQQVPLDRVHASQPWLRPETLAHNLFHPGTLEHPLHKHIGDPEVKPPPLEGMEGDISHAARFVRRADGRLQVSDGHHRVAADMMLGKTHTPGTIAEEHEIRQATAPKSSAAPETAEALHAHMRDGHGKTRSELPEPTQDNYWPLHDEHEHDHEFEGDYIGHRHGLQATAAELPYPKMPLSKIKRLYTPDWNDDDEEGTRVRDVLKRKYQQVDPELERSMRERGQTAPIELRTDPYTGEVNTLGQGHHRVSIADRLGWKSMHYVVDRDDLTHDHDYDAGHFRHEARATKTPSEAAYRPATGKKRCGGCVMFREGAGHDWCTKVKGEIDPDYTCRYYSPKGKTAAHTEHPDIGDWLELPSDPPGSLESAAEEPTQLATTAATDGGDHTGSAMISLDLPEGVIHSVDGGVDDHHIIVVYLGKDVDDDSFGEACRRAEEVAGKHGPLKGSLEGLGTFPASNSSDGKIPAFVPVNVPGITDLRNALADLSASEHKDYHPHVTLGYFDEDEPLPAPHPRVPVHFTHLSVHRGDDVRRFPLGGSR